MLGTIAFTVSLKHLLFHWSTKPYFSFTFFNYRLSFFLKNSITALENRHHLIVFLFNFLLEPQTFWCLTKLTLNKLYYKYTAATPTIFLYKVICPFIKKEKESLAFFFNFSIIRKWIYVFIHKFIKRRKLQYAIGHFCKVFFFPVKKLSFMCLVCVSI